MIQYIIETTQKESFHLGEVSDNELNLFNRFTVGHIFCASRGCFDKLCFLKNLSISHFIYVIGVTMRNLLVNPYLPFTVCKTSSDIPCQQFFFFFFNISIVLSGIYQLLLTFQRIGFGFVNFLYCLLSILLISALNNFFSFYMFLLNWFIILA